MHAWAMLLFFQHFIQHFLLFALWPLLLCCSFQLISVVLYATFAM